MRRFFKGFGYLFLFLFIVGLFADDEADDDSIAAISKITQSSATPLAEGTPSETESIAALPLPEDKEDLLTDIPKPVAFTPEAPAAAVVQPAVNPPTPSRAVFVTGSTVNVRASPEIAKNVVGQFAKGVQLTAFETTGGWTRVSGRRAGKEINGWMSARYLSSTKPKAVVVAVAAPKRSVAVPSSAEVTKARKAIIRQSLAGYSGNCPCPYNRDRAGRSCGKRSAWSRPGGYSPICYESDVTRSRLVSYFARLGKQYR